MANAQHDSAKRLLPVSRVPHANVPLRRHGKQGVLNTASNSQLENEFGTKNEDDVVKQILEKGDIQSSEVRHFQSRGTFGCSVLTVE
jgi:hypothetical protein